MYKIKVSDGKYKDKIVPCKWIKGSNFQVLIFDTYVIKIPMENNERSGMIKKPNTKTLKEMSDLQNELHKKFPECTVPSSYYVDFVINPIPKGKADVEEDKLPEIKKRIKHIHTQMNIAGYELGDIDDISNYFYDEETDKIVIIDYSHLQKSKRYAN